MAKQIFLVAPCCCKERFYLSLCDVVSVRLSVRGRTPPPPTDTWFLGSLGNFKTQNFVHLQKNVFSLSLFYAFLDVSCYSECSNSVGEARRDPMLPSILVLFLTCGVQGKHLFCSETLSQATVRIKRNPPVPKKYFCHKAYSAARKIRIYFLFCHFLWIVQLLFCLSCTDLLPLWRLKLFWTFAWIVWGIGTKQSEFCGCCGGIFLKAEWKLSCLFIVRSTFMALAPSSYGRVAILWFRQKLHHGPPPREGLQRPYGQYSYSIHIWEVGWMSQTPPLKVSKSARYALFNFVWCGNKRERGWTSHRSCPSTASSSSKQSLFFLFLL